MKAVILFCVIALAYASEDKKSCLEEPEEGMCRGYFESYYYDYKSRSCKTFIYGGCDGNGNRYATEEECMEQCGDVVVFESEDVCSQAPVTGHCLAYFERYYFDQQTGRCDQFVYGGCGGNQNNFVSEAECERRCAQKADENTDDDDDSVEGQLVIDDDAANEDCQQEKVVGPCRGAFRRYYFNKDAGRCMPFIYGGCEGNENNFLSHEECEAWCLD